MIQSEIQYSRQEVVADHGVVAAGHGLVAQVGVEMMQRGGNAIDAGVAAAFAAQLAEPGMCGVGGNGMIAIHHVDKAETTIFDDVTVAPAGATADMFEIIPGSGGFYGWDNVRNDANIIGHMSVAIPGTVAGLCAALDRYGTKSLGEVLAPAIDLAENGVEIDQRMTITIAKEMPFFGGFPALRDHLLINGRVPAPGTFWTQGDKLCYPELAETYRAIAAGGAAAFYTGPIAQSIALETSRNGGVLSYQDLATYASSTRIIRENEFNEYRGLSYTPGASTIVVQLLNVLENFDLAAMGPDNPTYRHVMLETLRRVWINHFVFAGESGLLTKEFAREVAGLISLDRVANEMLVVNPRTFKVGPLPAEALATRSGSDTTTLATVDQHGNLFNILTSLGNAFGSKVVVPGTGIVLNDHMCNFDPVPGRPLSLGPSRRPPQGAHVPVFFRDGKPFLALSAPGARRSMSGVIHVLVHCIDFGMGVQEAIETPRVWAEALYQDAFVDSRLSGSSQRALKKMGHSLVPMDAATSGGFGRPTAVMIDSMGKLHGGADPMYRTGVAGF